jgi:hypothetical protein
MKKPGNRATKDEIINYSQFLEEQMKVYEEKLKAARDIQPKSKIEKQAMTDNEDRITALSLSQIEDLNNVASEFVSKLKLEIENYKLVKDQINYEKDQLENIYKIKVEADSLFALLNTKHEVLNNLTAKIYDLEQVYSLESEKMKLKLEAEREKEEIIIRHDIERQKLEYHNYVDNTKAKLNKEKAEIEEQKKEHEKLLQDMADLQKTILMYDNRKEKEILAIKSDLSKEIEIRYEHNLKLLEANYEKQIAVLECTIDNQQETINKLEVQLEINSDNLKESIQNINSLASKTVDNYQTEKSMTNMRDLVTKLNENNKK